jgi:1,4-alpha-glucan branching enzyme
LDFDYLKPYLPAPPNRSFTGIKYFAISGGPAAKQVYDRRAALQAAAEHAQHFLEERMEQLRRAAEVMGRPPIVICPYDAELFGHWWYEGPEFLDYFVRKAAYDQRVFALVSPNQFLQEHATHQVAKPSPSSWGEEGYWKVWLNDSNEWIYRHLRFAEQRMTELARKIPSGTALEERALKQAARELMLAQASDWPFILRSGTSPEYARKRVKSHLLRFSQLADQITNGTIDEQWLGEIEWHDNLFPKIDYRYWA